MSDINNNININVQAQYESLNGLLSKLEEAKTMLGKMSKARINFDIKKDIQKSIDPIKKASEWFNASLKNLKTAQNSLVKAFITGSANEIEAAKKRLESAEQFAKNVIKTIEHTPAVNVAKQNITDAYNLSAVAKQMAKLGATTKKSSGSFQKLIGRIRNISIYRMIRTGIKWVTSGFQEGIQNFVQYSDSANQTLSNINSSLKQIKNTMGLALASVLQSLEPIITRLSDALVDFINSFNLAMAKMQGKDTYQKAKKSIDDYAKSLQNVKKLSFDTFEVLSGGTQTSPFEMFEEEEVSKDENRMSQFFEKIINMVSLIGKKISEVFSKLVDSGFFEKALSIIEKIATAVTDILISLLDSGALNTILDVVETLWGVIAEIGKAMANFIVKLNEIGALKPLLLGIAAAFVAIKIAALAAAVANAAALIAAHPIIGSVLLAAGVATLATIGGLMAKSVNKSYVTGYENGGIPEKSELFYMNEYGKPEALVNTGGNQTNVINMTQLAQGMKQGFVEAIYETGLIDAMQNRIVIDGNNVNDNAFARAIFPALKTESKRRGGNQL